MEHKMTKEKKGSSWYFLWRCVEKYVQVLQRMSETNKNPLHTISPFPKMFHMLTITGLKQRRANDICYGVVLIYGICCGVVLTYDMFHKKKYCDRICLCYRL